MPPRHRPWTASRGTRWFLMTLGGAFLLQLYILLGQSRTFFGRYPLAVPEVFFNVPRVTRYVLPALFVLGVAAIAAGARQLFARRIAARHGISAIFVAGVALHVALMGAVRDGPFAMEKRAIESRHGEYLVQAVSIVDLGATLRDYETYVRPYVYLSGKGPGVLTFFYGLKELANAGPVRPLLDVLAPSPLVMRWWLAEFSFELTPPQADQLRYLLALMVVLFPLLTMLPVFPIFWLGRACVDDAYGLLAAAMYPLVPAVGLLVAHLDFAVFPLCTMVIVTPFVLGMNKRRLGLIAASAAAFAAYSTMTLAALTLVPLLIVCAVGALVRRWRTETDRHRVAVDAMGAAATFVIVVALLLGTGYVWLHFDPIERYGYARSLQRDWVTTDYNGFWVTANLLGYFLSFGLTQTMLLLVQLARSLRRGLARAADAIDDLSIAWLCLMVGLLAFGRQHGETNRLWAFLSPVGCLIVARLVYDWLPSRLFWLPLIVFLAGLVLARYQLSYF